MGGRDHSCEVCGRGGFNNDEECVCPPDPREHPVEGQPDESDPLAGLPADLARVLRDQSVEEPKA